MSTLLCVVCKSISVSSLDFWSSTYDYPEYCQDVSIKLQSYERMREEAEKGCELCSVLLNFPHPVYVEDQKDPLFLRRCPSFPDRAVRLGTGLKGINYITRTFYRRVPFWWWDQSSLTIEQKHIPAIVNRPMRLDSPVDNINLMKAWLRNCQRNHKTCLSNQKNFLPTRLIDLEAFPCSSDVRIVDSESLKTTLNKDSIPYPDYVALSHCWGPESKRPITTNKLNLESRKTRIPSTQLSKTFMDAVTITRKLGQRYLWIDSLCIIQNSPEDWAKEAALMASVYGAACCTLAALSSEDGTQGCKMVNEIWKSTGNHFIDIKIHNDRQVYVRMYQQPPATWAVEYGEEAKHTDTASISNPLRYRAWTLQEAELSRRTIFFADRQLLWKCQELKGTAELPWVEQLSDQLFKTKPWPLCDGLQDDEHEGFFSDKRLRWYQLVEDYSLRALTKDSDKLVALAGLARDYQAMFLGAQYVAGMWGVSIPRHLAFQRSGNPRFRNDQIYRLHASANAVEAHCSATLLWRSMDSHARRYTDYIAPTWSWASVKGRISYDSQRIEPHGLSVDRMAVQEQNTDCDFDGMQWGGMTAKAKCGDPYGAVMHGACLILQEALLAQCSVPRESFLDQFNSGVAVETRTDSILEQLMNELPLLERGTDMDGEPLTLNEKTIGVFFRDSPDDVDLCNGQTFCLRIRGEPFFSVTHHVFKNEQERDLVDTVMCIVLVPTTDLNEENTYRRVGLARWVSSELFDCSRPVTVRLI